MVGHRVVLIETLLPHHSPDLDNQNDNRADQINATSETYLKHKTLEMKTKSGF